MGFGDWAAVIDKASKAIDAVKNAEVKQAFADVKVACAKLAEENARLREELVELRERVKLREETEYDNEVYWRKRLNESREGPFCPKCMDGEGKLCRMLVNADNNMWYCHVCNHGVRKPGGAPPDPPVAFGGDWTPGGL